MKLGIGRTATFSLALLSAFLALPIAGCPNPQPVPPTPDADATTPPPPPPAQDDVGPPPAATDAAPTPLDAPPAPADASPPDLAATACGKLAAAGCKEGGPKCVEAVHVALANPVTPKVTTKTVSCVAGAAGTRSAVVACGMDCTP